MKKLILASLVTFFGLQVSAQVYGPFYGASIYAYKSNLFNSDDLRADSFQKYQMTPSFAGSFEVGHLYENGISVQTGLQFGTNNQKYKGSDNYYSYDLAATTKTSYLKIPIIFGIQKNNDKKFKMLYSFGFYYSYNTGYSEKSEITYKVPVSGLTWKETQTMKNETLTIESNYDTTANMSYTMDKRPYQRHGLGAIGAIGFRYQLKEKLELVTQLKGEFLMTNSEITEEIKFTPINKPLVFPHTDHAFSNYAKYMYDPKSNWNRASTHPFNIGLSIGIRYYLFDF